MGLGYLLRRLAVMIPVFVLVVTIVFFMIRFAPGGPFDSEKAVSPQILANLNAKYHLDEPLWKQYGRYWMSLAQGDLGPSFRYANKTVNEIIMDSWGVSIELGLLSLGWALIIGITAGLLGALKPNTMWDYIPMGFSVIGICLPTFVIGPLLRWVFGIKLHWLPVAGWNDWAEAATFWDYAQYRLLPSLTLGFAFAAYISRLTRGGMMEIRNQDFIRTARAKGLSETKVLFKHAMRGGMLPVVSYMGPALAGIISGALVTEKIFNIPGLGRYFIDGAVNRDYTLVMGTALLSFGLIFVCNLLVDIVYVLLDPRVRYE